MTHVQGFFNALVTRLMTSAASADPLSRSLDPAQRARTINLLTFTALKSDDEIREEQNVFDKFGSLKDFRGTVSKLVRQDEIIQVAANLATKDPRRDIPADPKDSGSPPCLGI